MEWYYEKNGEQRGPTTEIDLKGMYGRGELTAESLIWREGMTDWASYGSIFSAGNSYLASPPRSARTSRGNTNRDFRAEARDALSGQWGIAALVTFLNQFLQQIAVMIPVLGIIAPFIIAGPLVVGYHAYVLGVVRREQVDVSTLFDGFSQWLKHAGLFLLTALIILLSSVVAAIPGGLLTVFLISKNPEHFQEDPLFLLSLMVIILPAVMVGTYFWLRYILVYFIANDEPDLPVQDILQRSSQLMKGQMNKFCWLLFSFTGWHILGMLAFGIGLLWSTAYMFVAFAAYYDDLKETA